VYKEWNRQLVAQNAKYDMETEDASDQAKIDFYTEANASLDSLRFVCCTLADLPATYFSEMVEEAIKLACMQHPVKTGAVVVGGAALGGTLLHGLNVGASATLGGICFHLGGVIIGGVAGFFVAVALVGFYELYRQRQRRLNDPPDLDSLHRQQRTQQKQQLQSLIEDFGKQELLTPTQISEFNAVFQDCFMKPLREFPKPDDTCLICHDGFPTPTDDVADGEEGVRAPRCRGFHWVHKKCHVKWARDHDLKCTYCRQ